MLPAFAHARRNSKLVAVVSGNRTKRRELTRRYGLEGTFGYDEYDACLETVDAVYIALPNSQHAEYTVRAARAGVHVLTEKPMAVTAADCRRMIDACKRHRLPAYREARRPSGRQRISKPGVTKPRLVKVRSASED